jgi:hypothetical protein
MMITQAVTGWFAGMHFPGAVYAHSIKCPARREAERRRLAKALVICYVRLAGEKGKRESRYGLPSCNPILSLADIYAIFARVASWEFSPILLILVTFVCERGFCVLAAKGGKDVADHIDDEKTGGLE